MKMMAAPAVSLLRKLVGPVEPNRVWEEPPPKTAPMSDPFPVCSRMTRIMAMDTITCRMTMSVYIYPFFLPNYADFTIQANVSGNRLAPPTSPPSMSSFARSAATFSGFAEPP